MNPTGSVSCLMYAVEPQAAQTAGKAAGRIPPKKALPENVVFVQSTREFY